MSLNTAANSYVNAVGTPDQISAERAFRAQMERYSREQLVNQINAADLGTNKAALESFIVARRHLYDMSQGNWTQMATRFGADPRFASQSQAMNTFLQETECDPFAEDSLNDTSTKPSVLERIQNAASRLTPPSKTPAQIEKAPSSLTFDPDNFGAYMAPRYQPKTDNIIIPQSPSQNAPVYLGLFTFFASSSIWVWMRVGLAQRRAIRYPCNLPIVIFDGSAPILGELRDLSQIGAKLETGLNVKIKSKLLITMSNTKRQARVAWKNQHFIGIKFEKALSAIEMTDILDVFSARVVASHEITGGFDALVDEVYGTSATNLAAHMSHMNHIDRAPLDLAELSDADKIEINSVFTPHPNPSPSGNNDSPLHKQNGPNVTT
ncbi:PilZ domain-containing protein [Pacificibacter marinus]|uniref:PilZ domain-containing protein n=1 Tax=Pacificibacter marinus TaxID=658057 RepID=UPI001C068098|nr:PilZ domain-containing protein [Pacificibacter marinus]MBU2869037.1 PilZ domain-containing protein [Pacificibacter marinus]